MDKIRLATKEEIESIAPQSDLMPGCMIVAFDGPKGPDFAVIKTVCEINPMISPELNTRRRAAFVWALETFLRLQGCPAYYFNVAEADTEWHSTVEHWGAERVNNTPTVRYKKVL